MAVSPAAPQPREMLARLRDLFGQRISEVWASLPELYLLIIFTAIFEPSLALLLALMMLFAGMGLADYTRAEFLRSRNQEYVLAARSMVLGDWQIIRSHVLPNSLTPVLAFCHFAWARRFWC